MQTVTNYYILNLAIADQCFLIGIPFLIFTMFYGNKKIFLQDHGDYTEIMSLLWN